jgi:hypothetical protein
MATLKSIPSIITRAKISQYLAGNDIAEALFFRGIHPNDILPMTLYMERKALEKKYSVDPSDDTLRYSANYVYSLCGKYGLQADVIVANQSLDAPTITGPDDATAAVGATATFTIVVVSTLPYTVAWYKNGVLISGQTSTTLSVTAALADNGAEYYAEVTNSAGSTSSDVATLTVTATLLAYYYVGDTDYYSALNGGTDSITYLGSINVSVGSPMAFTISTASLGNNKYHVYKYPASWGTVATWSNTTLNNGQVPDQAFRSLVTIGSWKYIISRVQISFDTTSAMTFS